MCVQCTSCVQGFNGSFPANMYLFKVKVNSRSTRKRCEICLKITIKTPGRDQQRRSGIFVFKFEHTSHLFLVFLLLTLNKYMLAGYPWTIYFQNPIFLWSSSHHNHKMKLCSIYRMLIFY